MKNNLSLIAVLLCVSLTSSIFAADVVPPTNTQNQVPSGTPSIAGQAAEAVVGRVFGVEGDASQIQYHVVEFTSHTPAASATRSLLIPGWGQYFNHQKSKGAIFFLTTAGAIYASAHLYSKATHSYDQYTALGDRDGSKYDDYTRDRNRAILFGSAAAVLWIAAIIDAYHNAYKPLYSQNSSVDVALFQEGGAEVRLKKAF